MSGVTVAIIRGPATSLRSGQEVSLKSEETQGPLEVKDASTAQPGHARKGKESGMKKDAPSQKRRAQMASTPVRIMNHITESSQSRRRARRQSIRPRLDPCNSRLLSCMMPALSITVLLTALFLRCLA